MHTLCQGWADERACFRDHFLNSERERAHSVSYFCVYFVKNDIYRNAQQIEVSAFAASHSRFFKMSASGEQYHFYKTETKTKERKKNKINTEVNVTQVNVFFLKAKTIFLKAKQIFLKVKTIFLNPKEIFLKTTVFLNVSKMVYLNVRQLFA